MGMLLLVLIGSTACQTRSLEPFEDKVAREAILTVLPEAPSLPNFPSLGWTYIDGLYGLSESDVDLLLDYMENDLPEFAFDYRLWLEQLNIVLNKLI